tara:strand:+ start:393 stop:614 length:222 start_codon:yes stop_codon:yes gene_type:complete
MEKICKAQSRKNMCTRTREYVDKRLEKMALLHASHGTGSQHDAGVDLKQVEKKYLEEIEAVAPEYYKRIIQNS